MPLQGERTVCSKQDGMDLAVNSRTVRSLGSTDFKLLAFNRSTSCHVMLRPERDGWHGACSGTPEAVQRRHQFQSTDLGGAGEERSYVPLYFALMYS